jgi:hypothetical protein
MSQRRLKQTLHHVVPSSRRDEGFETTSRENFKMLRKNFHQNWHSLFANRTPDEVLSSVIMVQHNVINKRVRAVVEALSALPKHDFYVPEVLDYMADEELTQQEISDLRNDVYEKVMLLLWDLDIDIQPKNI